MEYDPFSHEVMADPWPAYARLRREAPVYYHEKYDTWFLSRFEDVWNATRSDLFSAERGVTPEMVLLKSPPPPEPVFSMLDMPRQRDYRRLLAPAYTRRSVAALEDRVRVLARELLAPLLERGRFDVYRDLANPLATRVIAELIGLPADEAQSLRDGVERFFSREPGQVGTSPAGAAEQLRVFTRLGEIVGERMASGRTGGDDHISVYLRGEVEGRRPTPGMIVAMAFTMLVTGAEVVPLSVANTIWYLWRHPDQRRAVTDDPALVAAAFAESLRHDQPTNLLGRFVRDEVELRGERLRAGQGVMFLWASANRDEREFEHADRFDITRRPQRVLSYGHGFHQCIGEHLGNLEGRVLLEEILAAAPDYEVEAAGARRAYSEFLHGYDAMPVVVR